MALGDIGGDQAATAILDFYRQAPSDRLRASAGDAASRLGLFEAAKEIFPRLIEGRTASIRRQYAIALGNLFGTPGEFYRYVSGSESGIADRIGQLFTRLERRIRAHTLKLGGANGGKATKLNQETAIALVRSVREELESGREHAALSLLAAYADRMVVTLLGETTKPDEALALAFRIDPELGAFSWFLGELRSYLGSPRSADSGQGDVQRLFVLLILYYLESA